MFSHDEWDADYLQVPVPPVASRERPECPEAPPPPMTGVEATPPSLMGAFSALIQRIVPNEGQPGVSRGSDRSFGEQRSGSRDREDSHSREMGDVAFERREVALHVSPDDGSYANSRPHSHDREYEHNNYAHPEPYGGSSSSTAPAHGEAAASFQYHMPDAEPVTETPKNSGGYIGWAAGLGFGRFFQREEEVPVYQPNKEVVSLDAASPREGNAQSEEVADPYEEAPPHASPRGIEDPAYEGTVVAVVDAGDPYASPDHGASPHKTGNPFFRCAAAYTRTCVSKECCPCWPCFCAVIYFVLVLAIIGVGMILKPVEIDTDFAAFMKTDVNSSLLRDTFSAAMKFRASDKASARRLQALLYTNKDLVIAYEVQGGRSVWDHEVLTQVAKFEQKLRALPLWKSFCEQADSSNVLRPGDGNSRLCEPGVSMVNYARPKLEIPAGSIVPEAMTFTGTGGQVPVETTLRLLQQNELEKIIFPKDYKASSAREATSIRSVFRFRLYCCTSADSPAAQKAFTRKIGEEWEHLLKKDALPALQEAAYDDEELKDYVQISYSGDGIKGIEVMGTLMQDINKAFLSMAFVFCYLTFHTQSLLLGFTSLIIVIISVPLAYVFFALISGTSSMSIASFLSLFLIVGLGSDVVFVYTDFWRDAEANPSLTTEADKLAWTLQHAGKASLATTATTALSFFANLVSVLRPLREFGMFMGMCVVFAWVLVSLIFLPICAFDSRYLSRCALRCSMGGAESMKNIVFGATTNIVYRGRYFFCILPILIAFLVVVPIIFMGKVDSGVPNIFPADHNQNRGKEVLEKFHPVQDVMDALFDAPRNKESVCKEYDFSHGKASECSLFWCEVQASVPRADDGACQCFRKEITCCASCGSQSKAIAQLRLIGPKTPTDADLNGALANHTTLQDGLSISKSPKRGAMKLQQLAPVLLQEWETGETMLRPMTQVSVEMARAPAKPSPPCSFQELCFCGTYVCQLSAEWRRVTDFSLPSHAAQFADGGRRLTQRGLANSSELSYFRQLAAAAEERRLQSLPFQLTVASASRASVDVVWGLQVEDESPLLGEPDLKERWSFLENFDMRQPWAQRNIYSFCKKMPAQLRVVSNFCWIEDFRRYLKDRNQKFPVLQSKFDSLVMNFIIGGLTGLQSSREFLWIRDRKVKACYASFSVDFHRYADSYKSIVYKMLWDTHLDHANEAASRFTRGAWHTSSLWVRAEAQRELISSTALTLLVVVVLAFIGMLVFTLDIVLSIFVVIATQMVLQLLAFFIVVVMQWAIGPIEVIALIVFTGYAVTYSLHIAHKYGGHDALQSEPRADLAEYSATRYQRVDFALKSIGGAALGSAVTTIGCAIFLLFCVLSIFQKLGGVVLAVTLMSISTALFPLPAALLIFGPVEPGPSNLPTPSRLAAAWANTKACCCNLCGCRSARTEVVGKTGDRDVSIRSVPCEGGMASPAGSAVQPVTSPSATGAGAGQVVTATGRRQEVEVEDVRLTEKGFDIGEESPLEPIWAREAEKSTKQSSSRTPRAAGLRGGQAKPPRQSPRE